MNFMTLAFIWGLINWGIGIMLNLTTLEVFGIGIFFGGLCVAIQRDKEKTK